MDTSSLISDALNGLDENEQHTVKEIQEAINESHPFGLKIWKPALYRKNRSIETSLYYSLHPSKLSFKSSHYSAVNILWTVAFGWWMCLVYWIAAAIFVLVSMITRAVTMMSDDWNIDPSNSLKYSSVLVKLGKYVFFPFGKYLVQTDNQDPETSSLISEQINLQNLFSQRDWVYKSGLLLLLGPWHLLLTLVCFFLVVTIPMGKFSLTLLTHLLMNPLSLDVMNAVDFYGLNGEQPEDSDAETDSLRIKDTSLIICVQQAMGLQYYKYTIDGINVVFVNLISIVIFTLVNFYYLGPASDFKGISSRGVIFVSSLFSVIPLAYFIGTCVSSITAETGSLALGAVINASFGSIIEVILYCLALMQGKEKLVEGSIIGSFLCGLLALPGAAMFFGGLKSKEQTFNAKSAGVTSTMLILALIGVFTPTVFQSINGSFELKCTECSIGNCTNCLYSQPHPTSDSVYNSRTKPLMYICAVVLVTTYAVGLLFTLGTHAKKIYPQKQTQHRSNQVKERRNMAFRNIMSTFEGGVYVQSVHSNRPSKAVHGHPNWSTWKSSIVLLVSTIAFSLIADILIDCIDVVLKDVGLNEKFVGVTLVAIIPSVTEFYNAISFAMTGNIVLGLEIGSAYTIQVALLQIPALVFYSATTNIKTPFTLVFSKWDFYSVLLGTFILTYIYIEGKSNYFKGSILLLAYLILVSSYYV